MNSSRIVDPVCQIELTQWDDALDRRYATHTYHFCSSTCADRFDDEPAAYARRPSVPHPTTPARARVTIPIFGLGCGGAATSSIERGLRRLSGVRRAFVNPATEMAYVEYDSELATEADLVGVIEDLGYRSLRGRADSQRRLSGSGGSSSRRSSSISSRSERSRG